MAVPLQYAPLPTSKLARTMKPRPSKRSGMLAATSLLILSAALDGGGATMTGAGAAEKNNNSPASSASSSATRATQHRRLPQHRVRTSRRQVPYPENHPLGRHLNEQDGKNLDLVEEEEDGSSSRSNSIVGGDGSRSFQRRQQQQQKRRQQNRFLRFLNNNRKESPPPSKRRRRSEIADEPEAIQEGRLIENHHDGDNTVTVVRYWTISGRNLAQSGVANATEAGQSSASSSSEALLMDVEQIHDENGEAVAVGENNNQPTSIQDESEQFMQNENESSNDEGREDRRMEDDTVVADDDFDAGQYYNDQSSSSSREQSSEQTTQQDASTYPEEGEESNDKTPLYQPMRLRAIFTDDPTSGSKYLTPNQRKILMEDIINPALFAWSKALHLVPVGRRRRNLGEDGNGIMGDDKLIVDQSQLYDGVSCGPGLDSGLPSVRVPREHMTEGLADTDTVVYVSVSFAENTETVSNVEVESEPTEHTLPSLYHLHRGATGPKFSALRRKDTNETSFASMVSMSATTEVSEENQPPSAYPSSSPSSPPSFPPSETEPYVETRPTCPGTYLASATYCSSDQYDRPVAGILSLCISNVHNFFYDPDQIQRNIVTVMHEIGHILGFNAQSLANFRDADTGQPITPRDGNGDVPDSKVECTGIYPRSKSEIPLPSKDVMNFRMVRGGVLVATIVTPTVQRVASNMFGCRTLAGAELESGEGQMFASDEENVAQLSPGECIGDHWDRRIFRTDLMNTIVDDVPYSLYLSSLTLAYFTDSGWYKVDTDRIASASMWGRNAGCNFVDKKCITANGDVSASNNPFFCNNFLEYDPENEEENEMEGVTEIHGCDLDSSRKAVCSLQEYESPLPKEYDYFEHDKYLDQTHYFGGSDPTLDYCPVFEGFVNGQCGDENSKELMEVRSSLEVFGEVNSRCVIGHVEKKRTALCLPIACVIQEQSLMVKVDGYWKPCSYAGQIISLWWNPNEYIVCPDPSRMCPTFYCPNDCFGEGGICDYPTGQCMCAVTAKSSSVSDAAPSSWFSNHHSYQRFEPCLGSHQHHLGSINGTSQVVERIDFELPDYYVDNTTVLLNDPRNFDDKVSRMFLQLNTGEVVGLVASFMLCVISSFIVWSQLAKCYKQRILGTSLSKVRSSVGSLSRILRSSNSLISLGDDDDRSNGMDMPPTPRRRPRGMHNNSQKDKMVATLLYQMRTEGTTSEQEEQQLRLQLGGLASVVSSDDVSESKKANIDSSSNAQTIVDLSSASDEEVLVNRSDLPPLPTGGRVLAVLGARIVEDVATGEEDARSVATSATQVTSQSLISSSHHYHGTSEFTSPLYEDDNVTRMNSGVRMLRLRRHIE